LIDAAADRTCDLDFRLKHPTDPSWIAAYGADEQSPWCELTYSGVLVVYDAAFEDCDFEKPLHGLLWFVAQFDFFSGDDVSAAFEWLNDGEDHGWPSQRRRPRRGVRRVLAVIRNVEAAGG
jgi:hypothetical protein